MSVDRPPSVKEFAEYFTKEDKNGNPKPHSDTTLYRWIREAGYKIDKNTGYIEEKD